MKRLLAALVTLLCLAARAEQGGEKRALLVGVQEYAGTGLGNLKYCEADVAALAQLLPQLGYAADNVVLLSRKIARDKDNDALRPSAANIRKWLALLCDDAKPRDTVLLAFAGHGVQLKSDGRMYFCPLDSSLDRRESLISLDEIYETMDKRCKAGVKLLLVDACRNDPLSGTRGADDRVESVTRPPIPDPPGGMAAIFSCSKGERAFESDALKHGVFFYHLIEGLKGKAANNEGAVTVPLLEDYLSRQVARTVKRETNSPDAKQVPELKGTLRGEVVLAQVATSGVAAAVTETKPKNSGGNAVQPADTTTANAVEIAGNGLALDLGRGVKLELVKIPHGKFKMGSPDNEAGHGPNEFQHDVEITKDFFMGKFEVTQEQYLALMGKNPSNEKGATLPVETVTWDDAMKFCETLSKRTNRKVTLPTEAQWEYACRAGTPTPFNAGDTLNAGDANYDATVVYGNGTKGAARGKIMPVGSFKPNKFGLYDMHGNVNEWCADWFKYSAYEDFTQKVDPKGPEKGDTKVLRGGHYDCSPGGCRSSMRFEGIPSISYCTQGFRIIVEVEP